MSDKPLKIRDPNHKLNHHRKAGPMKDKPRRLTEIEEIEEQTCEWEDVLTHSGEEG